MLKRILVPLDGSARAERALPVAARIARAAGGGLVLCRVVPLPGTSGALYSGVSISQTLLDDEIAHARTYLDDLKRSKLLCDISVDCVVWDGVPARLILEQAAAQHVGLIVICSHGRSNLARWALGSVAEHLTRHAPVPVLVLREHGKLPLDSPDLEHLLCVLVPLDSSPTAEAALDPAVLLAQALTAPEPAALHLTLVVDPFDATVRQCVPEALVVDAAKGYLERIADQLKGKYPTLTITWSVGVNSDVATGILHVAELGEDAEGATPFGGCDAIVLATHGRTGVRRWALGSVAERVLHATKLPVMLVRPQQMQPEANMQTSTTVTAD